MHTMVGPIMQLIFTKIQVQIPLLI